MIAHNVFFVLHDNSDAAVQAMIDDSHSYLSGLPGIAFYGAGTCSDVKRPTSDRDYDVALHVVFTERPALDAYLVSTQHVEFMNIHGKNWKKVRVFDSVVSSGPCTGK
jgi:hypothetical protein